jgi:hypothetical protein
VASRSVREGKTDFRESQAMNGWTKPVVEEFDVNGECTAYAAARRAETLACAPPGGGPTSARPDPTALDRSVEGGGARTPRRGAAP